VVELLPSKCEAGAKVLMLESSFYTQLEKFSGSKKLFGSID
jgi:hypothetical protein